MQWEINLGKQNLFLISIVLGLNTVFYLSDDWRDTKISKAKCHSFQMFENLHNYQSCSEF